ncbi:chemotaxis response regulator protein-glutamate methylesterase [Cytobacillus sp. S13-E01]|uniref:protein-glutamate methylesterase/protein-glutamine glutaminase n=1 Tax=Cytobacillus sp. S13-E01 TaxID=3031326 RepID=UPI0023D8B614|nr:chemotaxis response regulator protein-glutamate methylesterase [Cytobacillus sp. S13-E01]MDF0725167.1 chemotaxis response regulator protein-glutamate methylesterase [Cytobacillus sp. S13-E01]
MEKIKVLIVDDSAFMRKLISDFLTSEPKIEVVGIARNGVDALTKVKELNPDVITMDVEMPLMNGLEALKVIMSEHPLPVIMLSSTTSVGAENTMVAMQYGAFDFITKPSGAISLDLHLIKDEIVNKVLQASKANMSGLKKTIQLTKSPSRIPKEYSKIELSKINSLNKSNRKILSIGTSTGGPRALSQVLPKLPKSINAPILIVQHMPAGFTKSLATRLDSLCDIEVKEAEQGDVLKKGIAYIAPGGYHLKVKNIGTSLAIEIDQSEVRNGHRPSVDVMFESISEVEDYDNVAVIMTGMGSDGSLGLRKLKSNGRVHAIAESEETSIVFGMPKSAIATNLVDDVVQLDNIANTILKYTEV